MSTKPAPQRFGPGRYLMLAITIGMLWYLISSCAPRGLTVSRAEYGDAWPFTVDRVVLDCDALGHPVAHPKGPNASGTWGLNGAARTYGYPAIDPYWRDNPSIPGTKVDLGPMIRLALEQCD